jgi:hypothetical protein
MELLPDVYRTPIRRLVRLSVVMTMVGLLFGVWSVEGLRSLRTIGGPARALTAADRPAGKTKPVVELPPELMWEATMDVRLAHGHVILIGGVLPLCFAAALVLLHQAGGSTISRGVLEAFFWLYLIGGAAATGLIVYKGVALLGYYADPTRVKFDPAEAHALLFGGSRLLKGLAYGLSHTILAGAVGIIAVALWGSAGKIGGPKPAA